MLALGVGFLNASMTVHSKFMLKQANYNPGDISADLATFFILLCLIVTAVGLLHGDESLNLWNSFLMFINGNLQMIIWTVG